MPRSPWAGLQFRQTVPTCLQDARPLPKHRCKKPAEGQQIVTRFREITVWLYVEFDGDGYCYWGWDLNPEFTGTDTIGMYSTHEIGQLDLIKPRFFPVHQVFMLSNGVQYEFNNVNIIPKADIDAGCRFEAVIRRTVHRGFPGFE